jgi:hypothetical protein
VFKQAGTLNGAIEHARFFLDRLRIEAERYRSFDQAKCQALFAKFRQNDTWQVPTLTVRRMWGRLDDSKVTSDPRLCMSAVNRGIVWKKEHSRRSDAGTTRTTKWHGESSGWRRGLWAACIRRAFRSWLGRMQ